MRRQVALPDAPLRQHRAQERFELVVQILSVEQRQRAIEAFVVGQAFERAHDGHGSTPHSLEQLLADVVFASVVLDGKHGSIT